jgi:serine/threonine protein kinase
MNENIVKVLRHGWLTDSDDFIDMEFCFGILENYISGSHTARMKTFPSVHLTQFSLLAADWGILNVWSIIYQIFSGLEFIHEHRLVHRDIKPSNSNAALSSAMADCLVLYSEKEMQWKISDFGFTVEGSSKRAITSEFSRGTASYRAPELLDPVKYTYTNKVDLWALGCVIFELVAERKAFKDDIAVYDHARNKSALEIPTG